MQIFVAKTAIGPSAMRNQGKGVLGKTQNFCAKMNLCAYKNIHNHIAFLRLLDKNTNELTIQKIKWGVARKALNLFLRDAIYNYYLRRYYKLYKIEPFLEIPLDGIVAKKLKKGNKNLPIWNSLKSLTHTKSSLYQSYAQNLAEQKKLCRVHLDVFYWPVNR